MWEDEICGNGRGHKFEEADGLTGLAADGERLIRQKKSEYSLDIRGKGRSLLMVNNVV